MKTEQQIRKSITEMRDLAYEKYRDDALSYGVLIAQVNILEWVLE